MVCSCVGKVRQGIKGLSHQLNTTEDSNCNDRNGVLEDREMQLIAMLLFLLQATVVVWWWSGGDMCWSYW